VRKSIFLIPAPGVGLQMSSLSVIQQINKVTSADSPDEDPFRLGESRLVPNLGNPIQMIADSSVFLYFVAYPDKRQTEKIQLILQFLQNGLAVSQAQIELPPPDPQGRIPYLAQIPANTLKPGDFEIRAIVAQGNSAVEEHAFLTLVP